MKELVGDGDKVLQKEIRTLQTQLEEATGEVRKLKEENTKGKRSERNWRRKEKRSERNWRQRWRS